ncbi:hypothetical protein PMAYCL1PPCAC_31916, partial [Pristionchus mayeri]
VLKDPSLIASSFFSWSSRLNSLRVSRSSSVSCEPSSGISIPYCSLKYLFRLSSVTTMSSSLYVLLWPALR